MPDMPDNFKARISLGQMSDEASAQFWGDAQASDEGADEASEDDR